MCAREESLKKSLKSTAKMKECYECGCVHVFPSPVDVVVIVVIDVVVVV